MEPVQAKLHVVLIHIVTATLSNDRRQTYIGSVNSDNDFVSGSVPWKVKLDLLLHVFATNLC